MEMHLRKLSTERLSLAQNSRNSGNTGKKDKTDISNERCTNKSGAS